MDDNFYSNKLTIIEEYLRLYHASDLASIENSESLDIKCNNIIVIDVKDLLAYDHDLVEFLLRDHADAKRLFEIAAQGITNTDRVNINIINVPESYKKPVWKIRSEDVGKFFYFEGFIRRIAEVKHKPSLKIYECPSCGNRITVLQLNGPKEPTKCGCGRKGKFRLISKEVYNFQKVILEEDAKEQGNETEPAKKMVLLKGNLADPDMTSKLKLSYMVRVYGTVEEMVINEKEDEYVTYIDANNLEFLGDSFSSNILSPTCIAEIRDIVENDKEVFEKMSNTIAPSLHGLYDIKKAIMLSLLGTPHTMQNGVLLERGNIHILLVGSPGSGKSHIMRRVNAIIPGSRYASGSTASGVGLVATVQKDEMLGGWSLFPGAIPLSHKSICLVDELDKISPEDMGYLNQALDKLEVQVDKASIHSKLQADTTVISAANPKHKVFDPNRTIWSQLNNLNKDLVDRFDLVFATPMISDREHSKVLDKIFNRFIHVDSKEKVYSEEKLRHYILYARTLKPKLTSDAHEYLKTEYSNLLNPLGLSDGVYLSNRIIPSVIRLTIAAARSRFSTEATIQDAKVAMDLLRASLMSIDVLKDGVFDPITYERVIPTKSVGKAELILKTIEDLDTGPGVDRQRLYAVLEERGFAEFELDKLISNLSNEGSIISPRTGYFKAL